MPAPMNSGSRRATVAALAVLATLVLGACLPNNILPTEIPLPSATRQPGDGPASLSGLVWDDVCVVTENVAGAGCVLAPDGRYRANGLRDFDEPGFGGVLVTLGLGQCPAPAWALTTLTDANGAYTFIGLPQAEYCITVDPRAVQNGAITDGSWIVPDSGAGAAGLSVSVNDGEQKSGVSFGRDRRYVPAPATATEIPTQAATPTGTPAPATATPTPAPATVSPTATTACVDKAEFVSDVTIPDSTTMAAGQSFVKTWRLRNTGACTWTSSYSVVFFDGNRMGGPESAPLPGPVAPNTTLDVSVSLKAPTANGAHTGNWRLRNAAGVTFGVGAKSDQSFWVRIQVGTSATSVPRTSTPSVKTPTRTPTPTATQAILGWRGEYFNNNNLVGSPLLIRDDANLDFNWGSGVPATGLPADNFSVRWTRSVTFGAGTYRFSALADDGVRLFVDNVLVINDWVGGGAGEKTADVPLTAGAHAIKVEYFEFAGDALFKLTWATLTPTFTDWKGEYWTNNALSGSPALTRNDVFVDFAWGAGSPATGIPADNFSARWTRTLTFEAGAWRFTAKADDGIRVSVDGVIIINEWHAADGTVNYNADVVLTAGPHNVLVEYFENAGGALVKLTWAMLPTPTPTATATVTATATATPTATETPTETPTTITPPTP